MATAETFIEELKGLLTRNMEANTQLASRVSTLVQQASREGLPTNANDLFARWLDFNLASATLMTSHSSEVMRGLVDAAERSLLGRTLSSAAPSAGDDGGTVPASSAGAIDLHVQGAPGETVRAPFLIANEYDRPLEVSFEASPLRSEGGAEIPVDRVSFEPPSLSLGRGQRVVQAAIAIPAGATSGTTYRGDVRVKGYQARTIAIAVSVNAPVGEAGNGDAGKGSSARVASRAAGRKGDPTKGKRKRPGGASSA
ncbi:MAG: hypothetical protein IT359_08840 [Gemmatimonadaceae bacterium]|nr:hypothetical protein [Gemmatimonadaceae bacterium]